MKGVILFGDSVFVGIGASVRSKACGKMLAELLHLPVLVRARSNDTTRGALERLEDEVIQADSTRYSYVVILFGNNDCRPIGVNTPIISMDEFKENLSVIIRKIKASRKSPILSNLQPIDSRTLLNSLGEMRQFVTKEEGPALWQEAYSHACEEVAFQETVPLVDIREKLKDLDQPVIAADGLHPNDLGHEVIAQEIFRVLKVAALPNLSTLEN